MKKPGPRSIFLPDASVRRLAESLVALANADGGLIVLGVDQEGRPTERILEEDAEAAVRQAVAYCRPPVPSSWQSVELPTGRYIGLSVPRSLELHSLADGRVLVRRRDENKALTGQEIQTLAASRPTGEYETEVVPGARRADLDEAILEEYLDKRQSRTGRRDEDLDELLFEIGATDRQGNPTMVGLLLFGRNPQAFFPQSGVVFVKFPGTDPRGEDGGVGYGRRDELTGPLAKIIERAWNIVFEEMSVGAVVSGLVRDDVTEYPRFAVREALVNAVAHRDYRISGRRIEIRMYADRLEIISPGGLPGYMTLENLVDEHFSRNPRLVSGLYQWGYIEELGLGIDMMIEEMLQAGHQPPKFQASPHLFVVTLSNKRERAAKPRWTSNMNERQARAVQYVRESGSITNREYREICPDVSPETLRLDLADLVEKGVLLKIGAKKGTYYILK